MFAGRRAYRLTLGNLPDLLIFNEGLQVVRGETVPLTDPATADVDEPEPPGADVFHERLHAHVELSRCSFWGEQRLVGERAVFHSGMFLLNSSPSTLARSRLRLRIALSLAEHIEPAALLLIDVAGGLGLPPST